MLCSLYFGVSLMTYEVYFVVDCLFALCILPSMYIGLLSLVFVCCVDRLVFVVLDLNSCVGFVL